MSRMVPEGLTAGKTAAFYLTTNPQNVRTIMGCDIHCYAEKKEGDKFVHVKTSPDFFDSRNYGLYGWMANVRNYSGVLPFGQTEMPNTRFQPMGRGVPPDASDEVKQEYETWEMDAHSASWFSIAELLAFDYDQMTEDRRCSRQVKQGWISGSETCDLGEGKKMTYREFLGSTYFDNLEEAKTLGVDRIVFWFDN